MGIPPKNALQNRWWLMPGSEYQLILPLHVLLTWILFAVPLVLGLYARSLGDVLNLIGCSSGTVMAFILPALFSFKVEGYSHLNGFLLVFGGFVGIVGTHSSLVQIING